MFFVNYDPKDFFNAITNGDKNKLKNCLMDPHAKYFRNLHGMTGLHIACQCNATGSSACLSLLVDIIERLVEAGFDVNDQDFFGRTPLHWACLSLMMYINNPEIVNRYPEAFFDAVQRYDRESLRAFFKYVSNKEATLLRNDQGCSALHIAVKAGRSGSFGERV